MSYAINSVFFCFCFFFLVEFISSFLDSQLFLLILLTSWRNHKKRPDTHFRINIFFQLIDKSYIQSSLNDFVTIRQQRQQLHVWPHPNPKKQVMHAIVRSMASNFLKGVFGKGGGDSASFEWEEREKVTCPSLTQILGNRMAAIYAENCSKRWILLQVSLWTHLILFFVFFFFFFFYALIGGKWERWEKTGTDSRTDGIKVVTLLSTINQFTKNIVQLLGCISQSIE